MNCSRIWRERYLHRCREQSLAIRTLAMRRMSLEASRMSTVGIDVVGSHMKSCRIVYGITR